MTHLLLLVLCYCIAINENVDDNGNVDVPPLPNTVVAVDSKHDMLKEDGKVIIIVFVIVDGSPVI